MSSVNFAIPDFWMYQAPLGLEAHRGRPKGPGMASGFAPIFTGRRAMLLPSPRGFRLSSSARPTPKLSSRHPPTTSYSADTSECFRIFAAVTRRSANGGLFVTIRRTASIRRSGSANSRSPTGVSAPWDPVQTFIDPCWSGLSAVICSGADASFIMYLLVRTLRLPAIHLHRTTSLPASYLLAASGSRSSMAKRVNCSVCRQRPVPEANGNP